MKICLLSYDGTPTTVFATDMSTGGLNITMHNLASQLSKRQFKQEVVVVCRMDRPRQSSTTSYQTMMLEAGSTQKLSRAELEKVLPEFVEKVAHYLSGNHMGIVHTCGSEAGIVMSILRKRGLTTPWVHANFATLAVRRVMVKGMTQAKALADEIGQRELACAQECDHILAASEVDKQETSDVFSVSLNKITTASPGVDKSIFRVHDDSSTREPSIISAGRMSKSKDFPFLLRTFRYVVDMLGEESTVKLCIIGGHRTERDAIGLPTIATELGITSRLTFLDGMSHSELAKHFRKAKVFAGVSIHETFGLLPVEARACGTPFVVRANSSYLATAENGYGGFFTDNNDEIAMADRIVQILNLSENEWQQMSKKATESALQYDWSTMAQVCSRVYRQLV